MPEALLDPGALCFIFEVKIDAEAQKINASVSTVAMDMSAAFAMNARRNLTLSETSHAQESPRSDQAAIATVDNVHHQEP